MLLTGNIEPYFSPTSQHSTVPHYFNLTYKQGLKNLRLSKAQIASNSRMHQWTPNLSWALAEGHSCCDTGHSPGDTALAAGLWSIPGKARPDTSMALLAVPEMPAQLVTVFVQGMSHPYPALGSGSQGILSIKNLLKPAVEHFLPPTWAISMWNSGLCAFFINWCWSFFISALTQPLRISSFLPSYEDSCPVHYMVPAAQIF